MSDRGTSTAKDLDWRQLAACRQVDPDVMFPPTRYREGVERALIVCARCPVRVRCLNSAIAAEGGITKDNRHGIAGGLTPSQRYAEYNRRRKAAAVEEPQPAPTPAPAPAPKRARGPVECGTRRGYQRHRSKGEPACDPCRHANAAADRRLRQTGSTLPAA